MPLPDYTPTDWRDFPPDPSTPMTRAALRLMEANIAAYAKSLASTLTDARGGTVGVDTNLVVGDLGCIVRIASTGSRKYTVRLNSVAAVAVNQFVHVLRDGVGPVQIVKGDPSIVFESAYDLTSIADQDGVVTLWKKAMPDTWLLFGNLG